MGGRKFAQFDKPDPPEVVALLSSQPKCYSPKGWRLYLLDVHRGTLQDRPNQRRVKAGEVPNYCFGCDAAYREAKEKAGLCFPPYQQSIPKWVAGETHERPKTDAAVPACPANPVDGSAARLVPGVKVMPNGSEVQPVLQGKPRRRCETPAGAVSAAPAGLCAGAKT